MEDLKGMSVNERLFVMKKHEAFNDAIKSKNTKRAIEILELCNLPHSSAVNTTNTILKNPELYGY